MLKQETEDVQISWKHTPPASPASARFDKDAIQEILETAAHLQKAEQDMLSQEELEAMAAEMGISPRHVRQAIALSGQHTVRVNRFRPVNLSLHQKRIILATILTHTLFMTGAASQLHNHNVAGDAIIILGIFIVPQALAFWLGSQVRYKRAGAVCGALLLFFMFMGMSITLALTGQQNMFDNGGIWFMLLLMCGAAVLGTSGAALQQWLTNRKVPYIPLINRPSNHDR